MARYRLLFASILAGFATSLPVSALSQETEDHCGVAPTAPEVVDGASASMEELVANSKEVTGFIADADDYLDCRESYVKDRSNGLTKDQRDEISDSIVSLTRERNEIGDVFNAQVAAYKEANPD